MAQPGSSFLLPFGASMLGDLLISDDRPTTPSELGGSRSRTPDAAEGSMRSRVRELEELASELRRELQSIIDTLPKQLSTIERLEADVAMKYASNAADRRTRDQQLFEAKKRNRHLADHLDFLTYQNEKNSAQFAESHKLNKDIGLLVRQRLTALASAFAPRSTPSRLGLTSRKPHGLGRCNATNSDGAPTPGRGDRTVPHGEVRTAPTPSPTLEGDSQSAHSIGKRSETMSCDATAEGPSVDLVLPGFSLVGGGTATLAEERVPSSGAQSYGDLAPLPRTTEQRAQSVLEWYRNKCARESQLAASGTKGKLEAEEREVLRPAQGDPSAEVRQPAPPLRPPLLERYARSAAAAIRDISAAAAPRR